MHRAHYSSLNVHKERNKDGNWSFHLGKIKIQSAKHKSTKKLPTRFRGAKKGHIYTDRYVGWISKAELERLGGRTVAKRKYGCNKFRASNTWGSPGYEMWK